MGFAARSVVAILGLYACTTGPAYGAKPPHESWTFTARFENDLFGGTDRFYTNGLKLSWISPDLEWFRDLAWFRRDDWISQAANQIIDHLPFSGDTTRQRNLSLSIGQMMFTPQNIERTDLILDDRPYAGWLYGSAAFHSKTYRVLDTFEIQGGLTGPWSLAEQAQDLVHELRGIDKARGWDNEIDTEFGIALIYDRKYRILPRTDLLDRWGMDAVAHMGGAAGTVFTHLSAGMEMRVGWNIPTDFGTALIRPAGETNAPTDTSDPRYIRSGSEFSFHLFASSTGRIVARDIFLDGNTFSDSHSVDKKTLVGDFVVGASLVYDRFKLSYAQVWRSEEFELQEDTQNFGSVSLSFTY